MAGRGSRLRPHTLTIPIPLIPGAGKPIVQKLVEDIVKICNKEVEEIAFIVGDFGVEIEKNLIKIAEKLGAKGKIYYQNQPLGTAHASLCAKESLEGNCVVGFADTLFKADFKLDNSKDGIIWVKQIEDPSDFGVVKLDDENNIIEFFEKPKTFISDLAIIGIYYFKDGNYLKRELQYLLDNKIKDKGEYQLTNALENMKNKGTKFSTGKVLEWLDCGNKDATIHTNERVLEDLGNTISESAIIHDSEIIEPCFISNNVVIKNSKIGPYVAIGHNTSVKDSSVERTIIQSDTEIKSSNLKNSMIGNKVLFEGGRDLKEVSVGDYSQIKS